MTVAVYGASGFTAKLVVAELRRRNIDPMLVGRDAGRLRDTAERSGLPADAVRTVGLDDPAALAGALRGAPVVINCVAPYERFGEPVARAAVAAGVHYVDLAGEQPHVMRLFETLAGPAADAGVSVVPMVNDGGFLADLLAAATAAKLDRVDEVVLVHRLSGLGALSRGSGRTALANLEFFATGGPVYLDGEWRPDEPARTTSYRLPGATEPVPVVKFGVPEIATVPRHVAARRVEAVTTAEVAGLFSSVTPELVESLPEGPGEDVRGTDEFTLVADLRGPDGSARGVLTGADTYGTTAVAAVEAALRLRAGGAPAGVLAPAQAFDPAELLNAMGAHGVKWTI